MELIGKMNNVTVIIKSKQSKAFYIPMFIIHYFTFLVASSGIEPEFGASETLVLSIVLQGHFMFVVFGFVEVV